MYSNDISEVLLRAVGVGIFSFVLAVFLYYHLIPYCRRKNIGQPVSCAIPNHVSKEGTPIIGGMVIGFIALIDFFLFTRWVANVSFLLAGTFLFSLLGSLDDWQKIIKKNNRGLSAYFKYCIQSIIAFLVLACIHFWVPQPHIFVPLKGIVSLPEWLFWLLGYFTIVGTTNAVNLTDGLDGLVVRVVHPIFIFLCFLSLYPIIHHWSMPCVDQSSEFVVLAAGILGTLYAFLCFNAYPASVFLGDFGSIFLGSFLGIWVVMLGQPVLFFISALVLVIETISVIIQLIALKLSNRTFRIFRMAPIHHHFEKLGWHENIITNRLGCISHLCVLSALLLLF